MRLEKGHEDSFDAKVEHAKSLLLNNAQYAEHPFAKTVEPNYQWEATSGGKTISFFGSCHPSDPEDPEFRRIQEAFSNAKPTKVYIEGNKRFNANKPDVIQRGKRVSLEKTKEGGEPLFTLKLAIDAGVDFESPEPQFADEIRNVVDKGLPKADIFTYFLARGGAGYFRRNKERSIEACVAAIEPAFQHFKEASRWPSDELDSLKKEFIANIKIDDDAYFENLMDPVPWAHLPKTSLKDVAGAVSDFRERIVFEGIAQGLKDNDRIFVVFGSGHAVRTEAAFRALLVGLKQ
jgi:hypothetical protein